ncbi:MAG: hypothetical protein JW993_01925 [Sedimentisphaerales bacterium]|nr:hypothetical protein [Sedimentisphaerales bacterium]
MAEDGKAWLHKILEVASVAVTMGHRPAHTHLPVALETFEALQRWAPGWARTSPWAS